LGHQTCKNRQPYNLYCVGADVKPCSINQPRTVYSAEVFSVTESRVVITLRIYSDAVLYFELYEMPAP